MSRIASYVAVPSVLAINQKFIDRLNDDILASFKVTSLVQKNMKQKYMPLRPLQDSQK
ncbi:hypothetical protein W822_15555 [Advenella kashmirensis W13003]|uniref:Uncharacterized protein n=1 Tax=Advenella kashmirensis W13003 TaxID=1424334 RepID=V8QTS9_9BURK|nr:hypothetical protein W822_15555 [Advenella kashmirensis W13003]